MLDPRTTAGGPSVSAAMPSTKVYGPAIAPSDIPEPRLGFIGKVRANFLYRAGAAFIPFALIAATLAGVAKGVFILSPYLPLLTCYSLHIVQWSLITAVILVVAAIIFVALRELGRVVLDRANETITQS